MRIGGRVAASPSGALRGVVRRAPDLRRSRPAGREATRETAKSSLQESARALAEQRYREARATVSAAEAANRRRQARREGRDRRETRSAGCRMAPRRRRPAVAMEGPRPAGAGPQPRALPPGEGAAGPRRPQPSRLGERWSDRDLQRFEAEDRELLRSSPNPADHAHRAGYERARFEAMQGPERERAEQEIEKARKRDSQRLAVAFEVPGRIVGRGRQAAERVRQGVEERAVPPSAASSCGRCVGSAKAAITLLRGAT